jgi:hypothetical protein
LIGEATKYNFDNLVTLTENIIKYYNAEKGHSHLNNLFPDTWASKARELSDHTRILCSKSSVYNVDVEIPSVEALTDSIETIRKASSELGVEDYTKTKKGVKK